MSGSDAGAVWPAGARWPADAAALEAIQTALARATPPAWHFDPAAHPRVAACFVCFGRGGAGVGAAGDAGWAAAALLTGRRPIVATVAGSAGAAYAPGHLALREGPLLEAAVRALVTSPDVLLVDATGRDHPYGAGLALHLGARLGLPTVGVTNRLLVARGTWPADERGATSPFVLPDQIVGFWVRTRAGVRPVAVHAAWRTDAATAVDVVTSCTHRSRTPEPLRAARQAARALRARSPRGGPSSAGPAFEIELE
jgi:deoxyribonuclease V